MREPRSATIWRHVRDALRHAGLTELAFAQQVVEAYHQRVALHERVVEFHSGTTAAQLDEAMRANAQILRRMSGGIVRTPADLEEAVVDALPANYRRRLLAELAGRYGLLAVPVPMLDSVSQHRCLADLIREFGEAVERVAPMLADGRIDASDAAQAPAALRELNDVLAATQGLIALIHAATRAPSVTSLRRAQ